MNSNIKKYCLIIAPVIFWTFSLCLLPGCVNDRTETNLVENDSLSTEKDEWVAPDTATIPKSKEGDMIRYGRTLVVNTGAFFGPKGKLNRSTNGMNCQNCHLEAGTKIFGNSYSAVYATYPKYRPRSGTVEHLEKRINDCMERSLNGNKIDSLSKEMRAYVAYINWVGKEVKKSNIPHGAFVAVLPFMDRAADSVKGKLVFQKNCIVCHGEHGEGKLHYDNITYVYPPLWGPHSYNNSAGLFRLSSLAGFIKSNMPNLKSSYEVPVLTDEEAWDVAAFICSMPRPEKKFKNDWPDIKRKPVDYPFGPFADNFTEVQHKYGPFKEIIASGEKK